MKCSGNLSPVICIIMRAGVKESSINRSGYIQRVIVWCCVTSVGYWINASVIYMYGRIGMALLLIKGTVHMRQLCHALNLSHILSISISHDLQHHWISNGNWLYCHFRQTVHVWSIGIKQNNGIIKDISLFILHIRLICLMVCACCVSSLK